MVLSSKEQQMMPKDIVIGRINIRMEAIRNKRHLYVTSALPCVALIMKMRFCKIILTKTGT